MSGPRVQWYVYRWNRMGRKGHVCRVLARGTMNSCLVKFEDGFQAVTSRNALRKVDANFCPDGPAGPERVRR